MSDDAETVSIRPRACLDDDQLLAIAAGDTTEALWDHVAVCERCSLLVAEALAPSTSVVTRARGYTFGREIARGGMGRVVRGHDHQLHRDVAIKLSTVVGRRFQREIELTARLQHPNIVPVYDAGELDGAAFYTMRPVAGQRLDQRITAATTRDARLLLLPHVIAMVDAIAYAHRQGVIHRDLKPQNVLVGEFGETVVIDWGLGKLVGASDEPASSPGAPAIPDEAQTIAGTVVGTPGYMAPEQARGEATDPRTDVYALGCVLFQTLTGEPPYTGDLGGALGAVAAGRTIDPQRTRDLPPELRAVVAKATSAAPDDRYADAGELAADLRRYQAGLLVAAHRYRWHQRVLRGVRRHRLAVAIAASVAVSAGVIGTIAIRRVVAERDRANTEREAATELLGFLVDDLPAKLRATGQLDVLGDASARLDGYYTAVTPARTSSTEDLVRLAEVRSLRGELVSRAGRDVEAAALSDQALELARQAEARGDRSARAVLARLVLERGVLYQQHDRAKDAEATLVEGLKLLDALPQTPATRAQRVRATSRLAGMAIADARLTDAARWIAESRTALADSGPHDVIYEIESNVVEYTDAQRLFAGRDLAPARERAFAAIAAAKRAQRIAPWRPDAHDSLARTNGLLAAIDLQLGDLDGAARAAGNEIEVERILCELDPDANERQVALAQGLGDLATIRDRIPGTPTADALRAEAGAIYEKLLARDPHDDKLALLVIQQLRDGGAPAQLDRADQLSRALAEPDRSCTQIDLARDRANLATRDHDLSRARAHLDAATAILVALNPRPPCARFDAFDLVIDRAMATPPAQRKQLIAQARSLAAALRAEGVEPGLSEAIDQRIATAVSAP